jgi:hypothetical protein
LRLSRHRIGQSPCAGIYKGRGLPPDEPLVVDDLAGDRAVLLAGPLNFSYSVPVHSHTAEGASMTVAQVPVALPRDCYVIVEVPTVVGYGGGSRHDSAVRAAAIAALLELKYPGCFRRGFLTT